MWTLNIVPAADDDHTNPTWSQSPGSEASLVDRRPTTHQNDNDQNAMLLYLAQIG